jgi:hypothetical protein
MARGICLTHGFALLPYDHCARGVLNVMPVVTL